MALVDVSLVTSALQKFLEQHIDQSTAWGSRPTPTISVVPPEHLVDGALGVHLYHLEEDAHFKNQPPAGANHPPVRFTPMALNLHYQLSAAPAADTDAGYLQAQLLLGCAVKAFHDYPVLNDATHIPGALLPVFEEVGLDKSDNRIRMALTPVTHQDAVTYWTAGDSGLRLAAYYQAYVVLLEPEEPASYAGRVFSYGIQTFVTGAPRIDGSENAIEFDLPGAAVTQKVVARPASVPVGSRFTLTGVDLAGDQVELVLHFEDWDEPVVADAAWGAIAAPDRVVAEVQEQADGNDVVPGVYSAAVNVIRLRTMPDNSQRSFPFTSNRTPFTITPRIDNVTNPDALGFVTVTGYRFEHLDDAGDPDLIDPSKDVRVLIGPDRLAVGDVGTGLSPGEYEVTDAATIELRLPAGLTPGESVPLRILVRGAESPPLWVVAP